MFCCRADFSTYHPRSYHRFAVRLKFMAKWNILFWKEYRYQEYDRFVTAFVLLRPANAVKWKNDELKNKVFFIIRFWEISRLLSWVKCAYRQDKQRIRKLHATRNNGFSVQEIQVLEFASWWFLGYCAMQIRYRMLSTLQHWNRGVLLVVVTNCCWKFQTPICDCIIIGFVFILGCNVRPRSVDYSCLSAGSRQTCLLRAGGKEINVCSLVNVDAFDWLLLLLYDPCIASCTQGSVAVAGAAVQWLRDNLGILQTSADIG